MTYMFLDIETTGLDPDVDEILEIAWRPTDSNFSAINHSKSFLVEQRNWQHTWARLHENEVVLDMHTHTGLLDELKNDQLRKYTLDEVYAELYADLAELSVHGLTHMAGRSIHFDRDFLLAADFGVLFDDSQPVSFHHRVLDLSSIFMMLSSAGIDTQNLTAGNGLPHRAANDIQSDIYTAQNIREYMKEIQQ